jgi:biotin carboxyl carrier protein
MATSVRYGDREVLVSRDRDGRVTIGEDTFVVEPIGPGIYRVSMGTRHWTVAVAGARDERWISVDGHVAVLDLAEQADRGRTRRRGASHDLTAPMPATVRRIVVAPHTPVKAGAVLVMLEAMKMELAIRAPHDGTVGAIHCQAGDLVQPGEPLLDFA